MKEFYIVLFDSEAGSYRDNGFTDYISSIIEKLRLLYFRNSSIRISEHGLLIVTGERILEKLPDLKSYIEDAVEELGGDDTSATTPQEFVTFTFIPSKENKARLMSTYKDEMSYLLR